MNTPLTEADISIIFYAFRYCLGRKTYAVTDCVNYLLKHWEHLGETTQKLIVKEIMEAFVANRAGTMNEVDLWRSVLEKADGK